MKPSLSQQTFFGYFQRRDGENKIGFKSDISKKLRMQKKKKKYKEKQTPVTETITPILLGMTYT